MWVRLSAAFAVVAAAAVGLALTDGAGPPFVTAGGLQLRGGPVAPVGPSRSSAAWCGADAAADDRRPDAAGGRQIHVVYAFPSDGADRFTALAGPIASDVAVMDAWWRREDPTRAPRFDLFAFPDCAAGFEQLDLSTVRLSQPASYYAPTSTRMARIVFELDRTFADPAKKYLVYYDGAVEEPRLCGQSIVSPDEGGRYAYSVVYAQACRADIGAGAVTAGVALHELAHNLGAVPRGGPPNACPGDPAHVCDDVDDLMYPYTKGQGLSAVKLDVGHEDYYGHGRSWWDLRSSAWLEHLDGPQHLLVVSFGRSTGRGRVTSDQPGIDCPPACSAQWDEGSEVRLSAAPADGSRFVGWSGACSTDPCTVTMRAAGTAVALFAAQVRLNVVVRRASGANGTVRSAPAGIACPPACAATLDKGVRVQLTATPRAHSTFAGWSGACGGRSICALTAGAVSTVTATFAARRR